MATLRLFSIITGLSLLFGCGTQQYITSYKPSADPIVPNNVVSLGRGERPTLYLVDDIDTIMELYSDRDYVVVGESSFNGPLEDLDKALKQAKTIGATHVLASSKYNYDVKKKSNVFIESYDYVPRSRLVGDYYVNSVEAIANPVMIPTVKEVSIFEQRAVFLVKKK